MAEKQLEATAGATIFASTGQIGYGHPDRMSTEHFYHAARGSRVRLLDPAYYFNVATYSLDFDEKYIYAFCYSPEESWTTYRHDLSGGTYRQDDYVFTEELYFRICLKRTDGGDFGAGEADAVGEILSFTAADTPYREKACFTEEIRKTAARIRTAAAGAKDALVFALLADSHYTVNGTWEDTAHNLARVHEAAPFDAIVHLGDLTDGMLPRKITRDYVRQTLDDLRENGIPLYVVPGNHDSNYYAGNPEPLSQSEQAALYLRQGDARVNRQEGRCYYFTDYASARLRCVFLFSFDPEQRPRYGFPDEELAWLRETLDATPAGYAVVVFSHVPPIPRLDFWSDAIRNGDALLAILEEYDARDGSRVLAYFHGHTHADFIYTETAFPIISVACAKCEYFTDKKPEGAAAPERRLGDRTQDAWDTLVLSPAEGKIELIRFGAGKDRRFSP
ncbi:MAG: metallophosphoesterase [Clostridiales Family XIII bacterium]|jgi:hypothetical protein|nr:metallophosphoesterase [Clostridiales Family XIII bacterium]